MIARHVPNRGGATVFAIEYRKVLCGGGLKIIPGPRAEPSAVDVDAEKIPPAVAELRPDDGRSDVRVGVVGKVQSANTKSYLRRGY